MGGSRFSDHEDGAGTTLLGGGIKPATNMNHSEFTRFKPPSERQLLTGGGGGGGCAQTDAEEGRGEWKKPGGVTLAANFGRR